MPYRGARSIPQNGRVIPPAALPSDIGEFGLIEALTQRLAAGSATAGHAGHAIHLGPGDDGAVVRVASGRVLVSTDVLVDTRHFRRDWSSALDVGHKAAAKNLSDINAMGGTATALTIGLALPADLPVAWLLEMADGFAAECALVGAAVVGGDITASDQLAIAVTALGECEGEPVLRSGARAGDVLALCGRQGWASAGLAVLSRGFRSPRMLVEAHRRPTPPYDAGPQALALGATAMIDVSDGLLADVAHIAERSGVAVDVDPALLEVPDVLRDFAAATHADPMAHVLAGGDDYGLAATFPAAVVLPERWRVIGAVRAGSGVTVAGAAYDGPLGHTHY